ncbi:hypothetical protein DL764_005687 [Monosporascus ibericus]|uniref:Major facilitator superfamily (MFS) profile domain-containing protein n=1 Tax=Monosporascus ibericus TaxID=155417 RepID=A0A4Q4T9Z5_9PEZI|nr:hypothetical protein DL764_005687 [Monosporascus ibericus]
MANLTQPRGEETGAEIERSEAPGATTTTTMATTTTSSAGSSSVLDDAAPLEDQTQRLPFARLIAAYLCLCLCYFTSYLDMNTATQTLPTISRALGAGPSIAWAGTAYLLGQTAIQPLSGRLSDIAGRKPVLLASVGCIVVGGLLAGFARSPAWLYAARALNGVGGGGVSSLVSIVVSDLVSLRDRGKYQGFISAAIGTGGAAGPFVAAGLLRTGPEGWRWSFWVPAVVGAGCCVLLLFLLPLKPVRGNGREKLLKVDWLGVGASVTGIVLLLIPISSGGSIWPWSGTLTISMLVVGGFFFVVFLLVEGFVAKIPIMPLRLFRKRSTAILLVQGVLHDFAWQGTQYFIPLYLQTVRGYSPMQSAVLTLPFLLAQSIAGVISGPIMTRLARYIPVLRFGFALWTLGAGLKALFSLDTPIAVYAIVLAIEGAGVGFVHQPGLVALQALSRSEDRAVATSTRNLLRSLGGVAGVAVSTAVLYAVTSSALRDALPPALFARVMDGSWQAGESASAAFETAILDARARGYRVVFVMMTPLIGLCLLGGFFVHDKILNGDEARDEAAGSARPQHENLVLGQRGRDEEATNAQLPRPETLLLGQREEKRG